MNEKASAFLYVIALAYGKAGAFLIISTYNVTKGFVITWPSNVARELFPGKDT